MDPAVKAGILLVLSVSCTVTAAAATTPDKLMNHTARFCKNIRAPAYIPLAHHWYPSLAAQRPHTACEVVWHFLEFIAGDAFRDPTNGLYCDHVAFDKPDSTSSHAKAPSGAICDGKQYSSAATGMGLVATCAFAEMGLLSAKEAERRARQTLESLVTLWPREKFSGFFVHFCDRASPTFRATSEFSTVDTAEMAMGALFAGNYFGGATNVLARKIATEVNWSVAIQSETSPTIYPTVNAVSNASPRLTNLLRPLA